MPRRVPIPLLPSQIGPCQLSRFGEKWIAVRCPGEVRAADWGRRLRPGRVAAPNSTHRERPRFPIGGACMRKPRSSSAGSRIRCFSATITEGVLSRRVSPGGQMLADALRPPAVAAVVNRYAAAVGLPPTAYPGHSLRACFVTTAAPARSGWRR